ncbi:hypothetical protein GGI21_005318, partial [Coemansia aciculifera]
MSPTEGIPQVVAAPKARSAEAPETLDKAVAQKVVAQVKHYFSDANLNHDPFMRKGVSENDGWVRFTTLIRFNKLRQILGAPLNPKVVEDPNKQAIAKPVRSPPIPQKFVELLAKTVKAGVSEDDAVEVNETAIRRKDAFMTSDAWFSRTVHAKGLPYGEERVGETDNLTAFFAQHGD